MSLFPELRADLVGAMEHGPRARRPPLAAAVAAAVAAIAIGALALAPAPRHERPVQAPPWQPVLGDDHRGHPTVATGPVPAEQLAALAVLRRPQTARDRSPAVQKLLALLNADTDHGVHVDGIRLLARHGDRVTILIPMERFGTPIRGARHSVIHDALCLMAGVSNGAGGTCGSLADLERRGLGWPGPPFGLVPDGVASVKLRIRGGRTIGAPVRGNLYDVRDAGVFAIQPAHWFDAGGHPIHKG